MEFVRHNPNTLKRTAVALAAMIGLTACASAETTHLNNEDYSPVERFAYDYAAGNNQCLRATAYSPYSRRGAAATAIFDKETGELTITPANDGTPLHMEDFDQNLQRVSPVSPDDQAILDSYGCDAPKY